MNWTISRRLLDRLKAEARAAEPVETCGILLGTRGRIVDVVRSPNLADDPTCGFELDAACQLAAARAARRSGLSLLGCYHSHPSGLASPSRADADGAVDSGLWLIVTSRTARLWRVRSGGAWLGAFEPVELELSDTPALQPSAARANRAAAA